MNTSAETHDWSDLRHHLLASFPGSSIDLKDRTELHRGHAGRPDGYHHLALRIVSPAFGNLSPIERHRRVYRAIGPLGPWRLHALEIRALAPGEPPFNPSSPST